MSEQGSEKDKMDNKDFEPTTRIVAIQHDADVLNDLGYKQELRRNLSIWSLVGVAVALMALPFAMTSTFLYGLSAGGPAAMLYNWIAVAIFILCITLSLAEICSVYPTAGSVYYWSAALSKPKHAPLVSYICGWLNFVGLLCGCAGINFSGAQLIMSVPELVNPEWVPKSWQVSLTVWALSVISVVINLPAKRVSYLSALNNAAGIWSTLSIGVIIIVILAMCGNKNTASYVFTSFDPTVSGWNPGWQWWLASLTPTYSLLVAGNASAMCEEVLDAERQVPKAMFWSVVGGAITGFGFLIACLFVMTDVDELLAVPSGQPAALFFYKATGSLAAACGLMTFVLVLWIFNTAGAFTCLSRYTYAFARDGGLPASRWLATIQPGLELPLNALIMQAVVSALLSLINIGSSAAFNALLGCATSCLVCSYSVPIVMSMLDRRRKLRNAKFSLGNFGYVVNTISVLWSVVLTVICSSPLYLPTTAAGMNYAAVCFVGAACLSGIYYIMHGYKHFKGPEELQRGA
ncbi:polyamine transporter TPO5 [Meredithblackwellia eburnea MCA 4105]